MESRPNTCDYDGCEKSFARKEHLARHAKSHNPSDTWLQCPVCKRHFNRNDSLQRHLVKHGDMFKQIPSSRSKRACLACRAGKIKCDGQDSCWKCVKRGIECKYGQEEPQSVESHMHDEDQRKEIHAAKQLTEPRHDHQQEENQSSLTLTVPIPSMGGLVDWTTFRVRPDPLVDLPLDVGTDRLESQKYLNIYWSQFHDQWPILHRPSFDDRVVHTDPCEASMRMIGAWILGNPESTQFAVETHSKIVDQIRSQLCEVTSRDSFQQSLPASLSEIALLNIIFGLYYGQHREVSRAVALCSILTTVLRDVGFFRPDTAWVDDKSGYFLPLHAVKAGQRDRLAYTLFKLNAYISMIRNQPMTILSEELHYHPPSTYAVWNANGLHIWEERQMVEPICRVSKSMHKTIIDNAAETGLSQLRAPMLSEDINLCLCALQSDIWKLNNSGEYDVGQRDALRKRLERLNSRLQSMIAQRVSVSHSDFGFEEHLLYRYYYGYEDHSEPDWQEIVAVRVKIMSFNNVMLYHLLSIQSSVDVRNFTLIAKDQKPSRIEELSEVHRREREQRQGSMEGWASNPEARRALCQAVEVFMAYQNFKNDAGMSVNIRSLDPICLVAICVSALVVWAFCKFYDHGCDICFPNNMQVIELTAWTILGKHVESEKQEWIEAGGGSLCRRPQLLGIQLCQCNVDLVMALFRGCLPNGWDIVESIAPKIFKDIT